MSNNSSTPPTTYFDLFKKNGDAHTLEMWTILVVRASLATVGFCLNTLVVVATFKSKNLRTVCNWLLALDSGCLAVFQLNNLVTFAIAISGAGFLPLFPHCFLAQLIPLFGILCAFPTMIQIGLERLAAILFPVWSIKSKFKYVHLLITASSVTTAIYLIWLNYLANRDSSKLMMCWTTDVVNIKEGMFYTVSHSRTLIMHGVIAGLYMLIWAILRCKDEQRLQNFSQNVFKSLSVLVIVELAGWFPALFFGDIMKMVQLDPVRATYISCSFSTLSLITASANAPALYYFSQSYRMAMNSVLKGIGLKRTLTTQGPITKMGAGTSQPARNMVTVRPTVQQQQNNWMA